jgi:hypothetical protein
MAAPQGSHIVQDDLPLPSAVLRGPFLACHGRMILRRGRFVNMNMKIIFILC